MFGRRKDPRPPKRPRLHRTEAVAWYAAALAIVAWPSVERALQNWRKPVALTPGAEVASVAAAEPGRGRAAESPQDIPARGWRDIFSRTSREFNSDRIPAVAGGVTFFGLLAVFPGLAAFVSLYGLFADVKAAREQLRLLAGLVPRDALNFMGEQMIRLAGDEAPKLGLAFAFSLLLSLVSANAGMKALFDGLNIAYEEREKRSLIKLNLISLGFTLAALVFLLTAFAAVVAVPIALALVGLKGVGLMAVLRWPLLFGGAVLALEVFYRYGPSRERAQWRWITCGSVAGAGLWLAASMAFSFYVSHFAHYDRTYGSLGAAVGFMSWMWLSIIVVLAGAELNAEIEHQTAVDSTTGEPQVMGKRGARMADTLGKTAEGVERTPKNRRPPRFATDDANRPGSHASLSEPPPR